MQRLTGHDAFYLYKETARTPMHTLKILVGKPVSDVAQTFEGIKQAMGNSLALIPAFRRRIVYAPFGLHHPLAIEDPDFDIDLHVHRLAAPAPGGQRELDEMVGQISAHPLDHSRPLWELWVVEGLAGGRAAYVYKVHHAIADGAVSVNIFNRLLSASGALTSAPTEASWQPEQVPNVARQFVAALQAQVQDIRRLPSLISKTVNSVYKVYLRIRKKTLDVPMTNDVPTTPFNRSLCGQRLFTSHSYSLDDFKAIKNGLGGTLNDAVLAVATGAVRQYLLERGILPQAPLVMLVPTAGVEEGTVPRMFGNTAAGISVYCRTDIADPLQRYQATRQSMLAGKQMLELVGRNMFHSWANYIPPLLYTLSKRLQVRFRTAERRRPTYNLIVSSVPGPRTAGAFNGFEVEELYSGGPLPEGIALNITAWSFQDQLNFGIVACRRAVPDVAELTELIDAEMRQLLELAKSARPG